MVTYESIIAWFTVGLFVVAAVTLFITLNR
jgi:hypothetical protein